MLLWLRVLCYAGSRVPHHCLPRFSRSHFSVQPILVAGGCCGGRVETRIRRALRLAAVCGRILEGTTAAVPPQLAACRKRELRFAAGLRKQNKLGARIVRFVAFGRTVYGNNDYFATECPAEKPTKGFLCTGIPPKAVTQWWA